MKSIKVFSVFVFLMSMTSCMSKYYYQVYDVKSVDNSSLQEDNLVFEDEHCIVTYDLWSEKGFVKLELFNKSDQNIYLDLGESFFVLNGHAYDYFKNRTTESVITHSILKKSNISQITNSINGSSVRMKEKRVICIPTQSSKSIGEYDINSIVFRDCELYRYPKKREIRKLSFDSASSPFVVSNRFTYRIGDRKENISLQNDFYVQSIINLPESKMITYEYDSFCGENSVQKVARFKESKPNSFYIKYQKSPSVWKH
ncbi:hypothetical protein K5X82_15135 [Halosquirtibacter xylanolyticus]|uniref:hypothetical protein n=1 Tax=Halosquirtibacter xylanolyticus TaxID=3374599 RepID=UPI0037480CBD|nr:hypothetical protein K5X82_15135 [Prolixibacteraceae bacterium]